MVSLKRFPDLRARHFVWSCPYSEAPAQREREPFVPMLFDGMTTAEKLAAIDRQLEKEAVSINPSPS